MPYSGADDSSLPSYVKKLPKAARARWIAIFNNTLKTSGESTAFTVANGWLKKHLTTKSLTSKTSDSPSVEYYTLDFSFTGNEMVVKTEGEEEYIEAVLSDSDYDRDGKRLTTELLYELAEQINSNGLVGDFDHEQFDELKKKYYHNPQIVIDEMKKKKGIAKAVKAIVENGKLWIRALIDKRYKKRILQSKGLSLEGFFNREVGSDTYNAGTILGFTFGEAKDPVNPRALIDVN